MAMGMDSRDSGSLILALDEFSDVANLKRAWHGIRTTS